MENYTTSLEVNRMHSRIYFKDIRRNFLPYLILLVFGTSLWAFSTERGIDLFQVGVMSLCCIHYIINNRFRKDDFYIYAIIVTMMISMFITSVYAISSFGYAVMFMLTFLFYKDCFLRKKIQIETLVYFLKVLIYAYCLVQLLQFMCIFAGITPINMREHSALNLIIDEMRVNGLSFEPSHTARICLIIMLSYMYLSQLINDRQYNFKNVYGKDKLLWGSYCFVMISSTSATAFLALPFTFLFFLSKRNILIFAPIAITVSILTVLYINLPAFTRIKELVPALMTLDTEVIRFADNSASSRINPYLYYFEDLNINSSDYWFGFGKGYSAPMLMARVLGHESEWGAGGIFPVLFYDYGLIAGITTIITIAHFCFHRKQIMLALIWLLFISSGAFGSYYQWLYICLAFSCKRFYALYHKRKENYSNMSVNNPINI